MSNGVIKTKEEAQDGKKGESDGTVQQDATNNIYSYKDQKLGTLRVQSPVTFDLTRDSNGNVWATNIQAAS